MKFKLTPRFNSADLPFDNDFDGSRQEAYNRAKQFAVELKALFRKPGFTVRVERTDKQAEGYEVGSDGHTV